MSRKAVRRSSGNKGRSKIHKGEKSAGRYRFLSFIPVLTFLGIIIYFSIINVNLPTTGYLKVPRISRSSFTEPLQITPFNPNVLGAQPIDPSDIVKYVNIERAKADSPSLRLNYKLIQAAQMRANVILKYQNFSHQDPYENITLVTSLAKLGYNYVYASENIGMGGSSGEDFVGGFMNSYYHRENLLNRVLSETGVAVVTGQYKEYYVNIAVQLFAIPGSRNEYLGYNSEDREKYGKQLAGLQFTLNPIIWNANRLLGKKGFTDQQFARLKKQEEILRSICSKMKQEKPFEDSDVAMILQYNSQII